MLGLKLMMSIAAGCQSTEESGGGKNPTLTSADSAFFRVAALADIAELQASELALERAENPEVRQYAQQMIRDHQQQQPRVTALAKEKGVDVATQLDAPRQATIDRLRDLQGSQFDQTYMDAQVTSHQETVQAYETAAAEGDPQVNELASKSLPMLRHHLQMAQRLQTALRDRAADVSR